MTMMIFWHIVEAVQKLLKFFLTKSCEGGNSSLDYQFWVVQLETTLSKLL